MNKYILGYPNEDCELIPENLVEYRNTKDADYNAVEWVKVEAETIIEAKNKFEEIFLRWQQNK